ncbi:MAG: hypothetical protein EOP68_12635 [Sphingomonas sp.]|nr:MAG: hypothetical protein EOP68_12635 [Sphingomonas sp.]
MARSSRYAVGEEPIRIGSDRLRLVSGLSPRCDVAEIYGGTVSLEESEDLGGLMVRLRLPAAG